MHICFVLAAKIEEMKQDLLSKIAELGKELPLNTLDVLIDKFGGPDKVSEVGALVSVNAPLHHSDT